MPYVQRCDSPYTRPPDSPIQEAFNHYRESSLEEIERRAAEIKGTIETDPNADIVSLNIEIAGLQQAKENAKEKQGTQEPQQRGAFNPITGMGFERRASRDFDGTEGRTALTVSAPKTRAGSRSIPLTPRLNQILADQRKSQLAARLQIGASWNEKRLVFATSTGTPLEGRNLTRSLHAVLKKAGIERLGVHALRHTFATRAIENGMDYRTLSEILGHSKVSITMQLYVHSTPETKRNAMASLDKFL